MTAIQQKAISLKNMNLLGLISPPLFTNTRAKHIVVTNIPAPNKEPIVKLISLSSAPPPPLL